jgi:molybdopterin molybdotransferase
MGQRTNLFPPTVSTRLTHAVKSRGDRRSYLRVRVVAQGGELVSHPMHAQGSGVSTSMVQANGLAIVEEGVTSVAAGTIIDTVVFREIHAE